VSIRWHNFFRGMLCNASEGKEVSFLFSFTDPERQTRSQPHALSRLHNRKLHIEKMFLWGKDLQVLKKEGINAINIVLFLPLTEAFCTLRCLVSNASAG